MGSALGEQCLFALVLGFAHCVGYELLCDSMVRRAEEIMEKLEHCEYTPPYMNDDVEKDNTIDSLKIQLGRKDNAIRDMQMELHGKAGRSSARRP